MGLWPFPLPVPTAATFSFEPISDPATVIEVYAEHDIKVHCNVDDSKGSQLQPSIPPPAPGISLILIRTGVAGWLLFVSGDGCFVFC